MIGTTVTCKIIVTRLNVWDQSPTTVTVGLHKGVLLPY